MSVSQDDVYVIPLPAHNGGTGMDPVLHPYSDAAYTPQPLIGLAYSASATLVGGNTPNTNLAQIDAVVNNVIDALTLLTCGRASFNLASVTARTLTTAETLNAILSFYGSPGSAATITVPALPRLWVVRNGTDQSVTLKCAGATGVAVATTKTQMLYCNGFDVYAAAAAV